MRETEGMSDAELDAYYAKRNVEIAAEIAARSVDISGLDKADLLVALCERARPLGLGWLDPNAGRKLSKEEAQALIGECPRLDYVCGRPIKVHLGKDLVDPVLYDRDAGQGAFAGVVAALKGEFK